MRVFVVLVLIISCVKKVWNYFDGMKINKLIEWIVLEE